ncbi:hypothetical protein APHAL10511_007240 [Amanita phalloides]|nr:hypothetical protein APHAL10511_007240 [Amanita phalloides]
MKYFSTRGGSEELSFEETVLAGLAPNGGLYIPASIPSLPTDWRKWRGYTFQELSAAVLSLYISREEISHEELRNLVDRSYKAFRHPEVTPLKRVGEKTWILELFHGPTFAFKDVALQVLGNLFEFFLCRRNARKGQNEKTNTLTIVGATSGDTGSAAIYGLRGKENISIFILHPKGRVSPIQEAQMTTVTDANVHNIAVKGTFDDCQDIVKSLFADKEFNEKHHLGAVNSINWARILAQTVYYVLSYFHLLKSLPASANSDEIEIQFVVPTGNFGDVLAGYYAKRMGLPMTKLAVATNANDILTRFWRTGLYEKVNSSVDVASSEGEGTSTDASGVKATLSPAMDILVSSNFERLLWYLAYEVSPTSDHQMRRQRACDMLAGWMDKLKKEGRIELSPAALAIAQRDFVAERVDDNQTLETIRTYYDKSYIADPHTAVGLTVANIVSALNTPRTYQIVLSTAHPAKFSNAVSLALESVKGFDFERDVLPVQFRGLLARERRVVDVEKPDVDMGGIGDRVACLPVQAPVPCVSFSSRFGFRIVFAMSSESIQDFSPQFQRPASPAPTSDFSIIDVDVDSLPSIHHWHSTSHYDIRSHAHEYGHPSAALNIVPFNTRRGFYSSPSLAIGGSAFAGLGDNTLQGTYPFDFASSVEGQYSTTDNNDRDSPSNSLRTLLPRIWEVLSSPSKSLFPNVIAPSPSILSSVAAPNSPLLSARHASAPGGTFPRWKGKGKAKVISDWTCEDNDGLLVDFSELAPLDGEEGELIDDEACFIDIRAVTGVDILSHLPTELALHILILLCTPLSPPVRPVPGSTDLETYPYPEPDLDALKSILACLAVSRKWRVLASDNAVWQALFLGRWAIDLRRANRDQMLSRQRCNKLAKVDYRQVQRTASGDRNQFHAVSKGSTALQTTIDEWPSLQSLSLSGLSSKWITPHLVSPKNGPLQLDWRQLYRERFELEERWSGPAMPMQSAISFMDEPKVQGIPNTDPRSKWEPKVMRIPAHNDSVYCLEFDSQRIVTGSRDRTIKVWSLRTGRLLGTFWGAHHGSVLCLKFEHDWDQNWDAMDGTSEIGREGTPDQDSLSGQARTEIHQRFQATKSKAQKRGFMVSGSSDWSICVWNIWTGRPLARDGIESNDREVNAEVRDTLKGHVGGVLDLKIDKKWIVSCSKDAVVRIWNRKTLELHRTLRGHEGPVNAVGLQNGRVVSASGDGKMILWDIESGERLRTFEGHDRGLACIEFKDDLIVSGSNDCKIKVWSASTGECLRTLVGHDALVRALSFDPRNGRLVSVSYDKTVKLWDLRTGKLISKFTGKHTSHIFDVKLDVSRIVSTSHDRHVVVLDFSHGLDTSLFV